MVAGAVEGRGQGRRGRGGEGRRGSKRRPAGRRGARWASGDPRGARSSFRAPDACGKRTWDVRLVRHAAHGRLI